MNVSDLPRIGDGTQWWYLDHRCPLCGLFWPAGFYAHGYYADHMVREHKKYGPPCDEDCVGCVSNRAEERARR